MIRLVGRHRLRANFYHIVAIVFLVATGLEAFGVISQGIAYNITVVLFITDYIAEMYDPHPDSPGPWFERRFHRFLKDDTE